MAEYGVGKSDDLESSSDSDNSCAVLEKDLFDGLPSAPRRKFWEIGIFREANIAAREAREKELELKKKTVNALTAKFKSDRERREKWKDDYMTKVNEEAQRQEEWAAEQTSKDNPVTISASDNLKMLQKARPRLINEIDHASIEIIIGKMTELRDGKGLVTPKQREALKAQMTVKAKVRCLLDIIYDQGDRAMDAFVLTLESPAINRSDLAQLLRCQSYQPAEKNEMRIPEKELSTDNPVGARISAILKLQKPAKRARNLFLKGTTD